MNRLITTENIIPEMSATDIKMVRTLETESLKQIQVPLVTDHVLHAMVYSRTILIPKGVMITGALIKCATTLVISGDIIAYIGADTIELLGYNVIAASAYRKQAFLAITDTHLTMIFATNSRTIEDAESEFTDETDLLISRLPYNINNIVITGE